MLKLLATKSSDKHGYLPMITGPQSVPSKRWKRAFCWTNFRTWDRTEKPGALEYDRIDGVQNLALILTQCDACLAYFFNTPSLQVLSSAQYRAPIRQKTNVY